MQQNKKFYIGVVLIISNFIVGKIAIPFFAVDARWGLAIYIFSWFMLFAGIYLCGREGFNYARLYYKHFKMSIKKSTIKGFKAVKTFKMNKHDSI